MAKLNTILLAPDSFKGSISARGVCDALEKGILNVSPTTRVIKRPLADGGEGSLDALIHGGGQRISKRVVGPDGQMVQAQYGVLHDKKTAFIEIASASGLTLLPPFARNPATATSFGTGELIADALRRGNRQIILGLGGSATNDYGTGVLQALGYSFRDARNVEVGFGCLELSRVTTVDDSKRMKQLDDVDILIASDVDNPLLGNTGATYTYALQKGAPHNELPALENALKHFNTIVEQHFNCSVCSIPGAGAAGGMGAGFLAFLNGKIYSGADLIMEMTGFTHVFETYSVDLLITGEGSLDDQTSRGKLPLKVAKIAKAHAVPVIAVAGSKGSGAKALLKQGFDAIYGIVDSQVTFEESMASPEKYLSKIAERITRQCLSDTSGTASR